MSALLHSLLGRDRLAECARNESPTEPEADEVAKQAAEAIRQKAQSRNQANDERALSAQVLDLDAMRKAGWL